jgi:hypothetical protein
MNTTTSRISGLARNSPASTPARYSTATASMGAGGVAEGGEQELLRRSAAVVEPCREPGRPSPWNDHEPKDQTQIRR